MVASNFDYKICWDQPVEESISFKTDIISSQNGREQRIARRDSPRQQMKFSVWLRNEDFGRFSLEMSQEQSREFIINHIRREYTEVSRTLLGMNRQLIYYNRNFSSFGYVYNLIRGFGISSSLGLNVGDTTDVVLIPQGSTGGFGVTVESLRSDVLGIRELYDSPVSPQARVVLVDIYTAALMPITRIPELTGHIEPISCAPVTDQLSITPIVFNATIPHFDDHAIKHYITFERFPVFDLKHNWSSSPQITLNQPYDEIDFGNKTYREKQIDYTIRTQTHNILVKNETTYQKLIQIFMDCKGRQKPFWYISPLTELMPVKDITPRNSLTLSGRTWYDYYLDDDRYEYFRLYKKDGSWITLKIIHARLDANEDTVLQVVELPLNSANGPVGETGWDERWGYNWGGSVHQFAQGYDPSQMYCRWMLLSRFDNDRLVLNWHTKTVAEARVAIRQLHLSGV